MPLCFNATYRCFVKLLWVSWPQKLKKTLCFDVNVKEEEEERAISPFFSISGPEEGGVLLSFPFLEPKDDTLRVQMDSMDGLKA